MQLAYPPMTKLSGRVEDREQRRYGAYRYAGVLGGVLGYAQSVQSHGTIEFR